MQYANEIIDDILIHITTHTCTYMHCDMDSQHETCIIILALVHRAGVINLHTTLVHARIMQGITIFSKDSSHACEYIVVQNYKTVLNQRVCIHVYMFKTLLHTNYVYSLRCLTSHLT